MDTLANDYNDLSSDFDDRMESEEEYLIEEIDDYNPPLEEDNFYRHLEEY